ncbi:MAG: hypothetical protein O7G85_16420 [Planctomycetota bacterium]|nr:hypothetical protein [Planctomycetota bacterium]
MSRSCRHRFIAVMSVLLVGLQLASAQSVTTIITHGYSLDSTKGAWIEGMADAIVARAGSGAVCRYEQSTGAWRLVNGTLAIGQPVCLIFRWLEDFDKPGPNWAYGEAAADALYGALRDPDFIDALGAPLGAIELIKDRDLHFLGHSRGTVVNSETVERLGVACIQVDHVTSFDPHPMNGTLDVPINYDWGDPEPRRWSNVVFHDNYWRADGGWFNAADPDGMPIADALNLEFSESTLNCCGYGNAHSDTHLWYHGTIDLTPLPCDGEQCITQTMRDTWWTSGYTEVGYYHSQIGGGAAFRPAQSPGFTPGPVATIFGGSFDQASQAGWRFHGGFLNGAIVNESGITFLKLGSGPGTSATHNRFHLPFGASAIELSYRILSPDTVGGDDQLAMSLIDTSGVVIALPGTIDLTQPDAGWQGGATFTIPPQVERDRKYRLQVMLQGGAQTDAIVGVDDLQVIIEVCAGDVDGNTVVDVNDLLALLALWGTDPGNPADTNSDGTVDVLDLLDLLAVWGACP